MRYALLATTVLCAFAVGTYACGGDDDNASIPDQDAGGKSSSSSSSSSSGNESSSSSSTGGSSTSSSSSSGSSGNTSSGSTPADAGEVGDASSIPDSGGLIPDSDTTASDGAAGHLCQFGSVQEHEDNGTVGTANQIPGKTGTFCGSLTTPSDVDVVQFTLPADAATLDIATQSASAGFVLKGSVMQNGTPVSFDLTGANAGKFPFVAGGVYTLTATSTAASGATDYVIGVTITENTAPASLCKNDSTKEATEPNDTTPTPVTLNNGAATFCGVLSSTTDVDEFSIVLPSGFGHLSTNVSFSNGTNDQFHIAVTDNGTSVSSTNIPLTAGDTYVFKFTSDIGNTAYLYTFTLSQ